MCSDKLIANTIANPPELNVGQDVLHGDLKCLHYDLVDMHKLTPKIKEVMEFQIQVIVKQFMGKFAVWRLGCIALFGP
jgi:hypothetical protein